MCKRRVVRRTVERYFVVQDDMQWHRFQERRMASLEGEGLQEAAFLDLRQNLRRDAAADVDAAGGKEFQCDVARLRTVERHKGVEHLHADGVRALQPGARDRRSRRRVRFHLFGQPGWLRLSRSRAEEFIQRAEAGSGKYPFVAHALMLREKESEQIHLQLVTGSEIRM